MKAAWLWWSIAVVACGFLASGCADDGDDEGGWMFRIVGQETNGPVLQMVFCDEEETQNQRMVTRTCDDAQVTLTICTDAPQCDAVMDAAAAQVAACEVDVNDGTDGGEEVEVSATCP